jgi:hypothetical protein
MGTEAHRWASVPMIIHRFRAPALVVMTLLLLETQQSHDHESGRVTRRPYWTGMILRYCGPALEQAAKGKGTRLDWV